MENSPVSKKGKGAKMPRPDRVTRLIRLIAVTEAMTITTNDRHREALFVLSQGITKDLSDDDCIRIGEDRRRLAAEASKLLDEWATDTP